MIIKWFGHTSFELKIKDKVIYIDPYAGEHEEYTEKADIILISNFEYSHCCLELLKQLRHDGTTVLGTREAASQSYGIQLITPGEKREYDSIKITAVKAYHFRRTGHGGASLGFLIEAEKKSIYYMGDTDYIPEMKEIKADIVIAPVGGTYVMDAEEAAKAVEALNPKIAIPSHYGKTGHLSDAEHFRDILERGNIKVLLLERGKIKEI